jgi:hypothetical protein
VKASDATTANGVAISTAIATTKAATGRFWSGAAISSLLLAGSPAASFLPFTGHEEVGAMS